MKKPTTEFYPEKLKTCLRYPGGKSKALKYISTVLPSGISEFRDTFLGGGSVPLMVTQCRPDLPVWVNDKYFILYNFWVQLQSKGEQLTERLLNEMPELPENGDFSLWGDLFDRSKNILSDTTNNTLDLAVAFYIVNKTSYSGLTERGTFSRTTVGNNISVTSVSKLPLYADLIKNWKITNEDYSVPMLERGEDVFVFLDPPYDIKSFLYGGREGNLHQSFSHSEFADNVDKCPHRFAITYNVNEWITDRYKEYQQTPWQIRYSMNHRGEKGSKDNIKTELLIHNYNLP